VLWKRLSNLLTISVSLFVRLLLHLGRRDAVLVVTNPPLLPFLARVAAAFRRARCVVLVHDVYPGAAVAAGLLRPQSWLTRLLWRLTGWLGRSCDRVVVIGRDLRELLAAHGGDAARTAVIPLWSDADQVYPMPRDENRLLKSLNLADKFVVSCAGTLGRVHNVEALAAAAEKLRANREIHFLVLGSGKKKAWLLETIAARGLDNVTVLDHRPRHESLDFLNACDVALSLFVPGMLGISVPSRAYNVLAAGKPIIAMSDPQAELALLICEERVGWVVPPDDADRLCDAILAACRDRGALASMAVRARAVAAAKYTRQHAAAAFARLFGDLMTPASATRRETR
jgi:glycosyltransferase involved in cell wall biosynthesis